MAEISTRTISVNGVRSLVRTAGPATGAEAVVFMHGNPGSSEDWLHLMSRVGEFARAIAPDMPGYGKADRPKDFPYTVPGYAQHLAGLLDQLGVEHAHLVLHDFGGPWGLTWAAEHPTSVASFTLFNMGLLVGYKWHKYARIWRTPLLGELFMLMGTRRIFHRLLNAENPRPFPPAFLDRMFDDNATWGSKRAVLKLYRHTSDPGEMSRKLAEKLTPLRLPALVIWGKGDSFLSHTMAEQQKKYFRDVAIHMFDDCGHWPFIDEPEKCAELVVPFLKQQLGQAQPAR